MAPPALVETAGPVGSTERRVRRRLVEGAEPEDIERALRGIVRDQVVFDATLAVTVLNPRPGLPPPSRSPSPMLTGREVEVLNLIAAGSASRNGFDPLRNRARLAAP